jgi:Cd2+/Zn2+-exporting ATPase
MTRKQKKNLIRIIIAFCFLLTGFLAPVGEIFEFAFFVAAYLIVGYDILIKAVRGIINLQPLM